MGNGTENGAGEAGVRAEPVVRKKNSVIYNRGIFFLNMKMTGRALLREHLLLFGACAPVFIFCFQQGKQIRTHGCPSSGFAPSQSHPSIIRLSGEVAHRL
jgi:hypothetical protein